VDFLENFTIYVKRFTSRTRGGLEVRIRDHHHQELGARKNKQGFGISPSCFEQPERKKRKQPFQTRFSMKNQQGVESEISK